MQEKRGGVIQRLAKLQNIVVWQSVIRLPKP